jgi:hypothetical protein
MKDKKTFEKDKDFFRVNVGLMVLWLLFQQTTHRMGAWGSIVVKALRY